MSDRCTCQDTLTDHPAPCPVHSNAPERTLDEFFDEYDSPEAAVLSWWDDGGVKRLYDRIAAVRSGLEGNLDKLSTHTARLEAAIRRLEQERDELDAHLMETLDQLDNCRLGLIDCRKSRSFELRRLEQEVERLRSMVCAQHEIKFTYYGGCKCDDCKAHRALTKPEPAALHERGNDE
jgi:hypothetical protein